MDKRKSFNTATSPLSATLVAAMKDTASKDTQLATLNATYYTAARLQEMTENDKDFHLRVGYDNAGI